MSLESRMRKAGLFGKKSPRHNHHARDNGNRGRQNAQVAGATACVLGRSGSHPVVSRDCWGAPMAGKDEVKEQVFWLRGRPTHPAFPRFRTVAFMGLSSLVTAAEPFGICTRFPILPQLGYGHSFLRQIPQYVVVSSQRTTRYWARRRAFRQEFCALILFTQAAQFPSE